MKDLKDWYNNLYRGEKYIVMFFTALLIFALLLWVTHTPSERKHPKHIILAPR